MSTVQLRCRTSGTYTIEVGGVLGLDGLNRGRRWIVVSPDGSWRLALAADRGADLRWPELVVAPALCDAHVHLHPDVDLREYVRHGVCRVRDLGSRVGDGPEPSGCADPLPEVVRGGPMLDRPGRRRLLITVAWETPEELPALLDDAVARGSTWVKLYEGFPVELFPRAVALAHERGLRVAVHPAPGDYVAALAAGVDELEHLACLVPPGARGTYGALARWAARRPGDDWPAVPAGAAVCPTLATTTNLVDEARRGWTFTGHEPRLAAFWRGSAIADHLWTPAQLADGERAVAALRAGLGELDRAGVRWVVGSDTPNPGLRPGQSLWQEMNLLVEAGLNRLRVYRTAAVAPGVDATGRHPLVLLPPAALETGPFPVTPPAATLLRGCLHTPAAPEESRVPLPT